MSGPAERSRPRPAGARATPDAVADAAAAGANAAAAVAALPEAIAFLGFGLIGGSIALALRHAGYRGRIVAWTPEGRGPAEAQRRGIVDEAATSAGHAIEGAELVVLAGPPLSILASLDVLPATAASAGPVPSHDLVSGATITDVGSTKARIVAAADAAGLAFVGGHPMAGRETTGVESASPDLFVDRPWVVVPGAHARPVDLQRVEALAAATGARPIRLAPAEHDQAVAAISHLPLVMSAALVEAVALAPDAAAGWPLARELAASGWRDTTRLARGDPEMGAGILSTNGAAVAAGLRVLRAVVDRWITRLEADTADGRDGSELQAALEAARRAVTSESP